MNLRGKVKVTDPSTSRDRIGTDIFISHVTSELYSTLGAWAAAIIKDIEVQQFLLDFLLQSVAFIKLRSSEIVCLPRFSLFQKKIAFTEVFSLLFQESISRCLFLYKIFFFSSIFRREKLGLNSVLHLAMQWEVEDSK